MVLVEIIHPSGSNGITAGKSFSKRLQRLLQPNDVVAPIETSWNTGKLIIKVTNGTPEEIQTIIDEAWQFLADQKVNALRQTVQQIMFFSPEQTLLME